MRHDVLTLTCPFKRAFGCSFIRFFVLMGLLLTSIPAFSQDTELFPFFPQGDSVARLWQKPGTRKEAGADGQVRVEGDRFVTDAGEIRFWGVNTCFSMNFPDKDDAVKYAKRMADFGINLVRLHHMDKRDIWGQNIKRTMTEIDPEQLDRLDWLIYQFKKNGIYVDINLHVSRQFDERDGFTRPNGRPSHDKGVDNFEPRMIQLQKKYAHDLLTHVNPYTKLAYIEDPCVAVIEINNENSVVATWYWGALDSLAPEYADQLQHRWNEWLAKRYHSTEELFKSWECQSIPLGEELLAERKDGAKERGWHLETDAQTKAKLDIRDDANAADGQPKLHLTVEQMGEVNWHPQCYFRTFAVKPETLYTLTFRARAKQPRQLNVNLVQCHPEWENLGFRAPIEVTTEWKTFTFTFMPNGDEKARLGFSNFAPGEFFFDEISLKEGGRIGPEEGCSLEAGTIPVPRRTSADRMNPPAAKRDFVAFLFDLENEYWQTMYHYVKDELKAAAPVSGTQLEYGSHFAQAALDYCDLHAYWNHPVFPGVAWDGGNWYVKNRALVNSFGTGSTLARLACNRVLGRPLTISEYNHPYPNQYGAECSPEIASIGAFQGWNGIFIFAWSHSKGFSRDLTPSFFDVCANPVQLVHFPASRNLFVRGDVKAAKELTVYEISRQQELDCFAKASNSYGRSAVSPIAMLDRALVSRTGVRLPELKLPLSDALQKAPAVQRAENYEAPKKTASPDGQLIWNAEVENNGFYQVDTPKTKVFTGFVHGRTFQYKDGTKIAVGKTLLDWTTITLTRAGKHRMLLSATGVMRNSDSALGVYEAGEIKDTPNEELCQLLDANISHCRKHGHAPVLCEGIPAVITLPVPANAKDGVVKYYPLDENANRQQELIAKPAGDGFVEIAISPEYKTLWYEIEW